jgi:hypothetical protein
VRVQEVIPVKPEPEYVTIVPGGPEVVLKVSVCAYAGLGIRTAGTDKSNADVSSSTKYRELTRRVINSKHAIWVSRVLTI